MEQSRDDWKTRGAHWAGAGKVDCGQMVGKSLRLKAKSSERCASELRTVTIKIKIHLVVN